MCKVKLRAVITSLSKLGIIIGVKWRYRCEEVGARFSNSLPFSKAFPSKNYTCITKDYFFKI